MKRLFMSIALFFSPQDFDCSFLLHQEVFFPSTMRYTSTIGVIHVFIYDDFNLVGTSFFQALCCFTSALLRFHLYHFVVCICKSVSVEPFFTKQTREEKNRIIPFGVRCACVSVTTLSWLDNVTHYEYHMPTTKRSIILLLF